MLKKAFLAGLITMLLLSGTVGCGGAEAEKEPITTPDHTPTPTLPPTLKPETSKSPEITGTVTLAPEAKGKIEITHQASVFSTPIEPVIAVTIKNVGNEPIRIWHYTRNEYGSLFYKIISKDKGGKVLEEETRLTVYADSVSLRPKEIQNYEVFLFPSDETRSCEIIVGYMEWPEITGKFVSNPEFSAAEAKLNVSHRVEKVSDALGNYLAVAGEVRVEEVIELLKIKSTIGVGLYLQIVFKDAGDKEVKTQKTELFAGSPGYRLKPGQTQSFKLNVPKQEGAKSYELSLIVY